MKKVIIYLIEFFLSILVADAQPAVTANLGKLTLQVGTYTSVIPAGSSMNVIGFTLSEKVLFQATASLTNIYIPGIWKIPDSGSNYAFTAVGNTITATLVAGEYRMMVMNTSSTGGVVSINLTAVATPQFPSENSFSSDRNYIITSMPQKEKTTASFDINEELVTVQYFDGLGRPVQVIQRGATPSGADLVTYEEYDPFGREDRSWLPAVVSGNKGAFMTLPSYKTQAMSTYNSTTYNTVADSIAYSRPVYEVSPLNRVSEQYGPGVDWKINKRAIRTGYLTNMAKSGTAWADADSLVCGLYKTTDDKKTISLSRAANYGAGELYVTRMKDENENVSYEFKDKQGQVVLTRQINSGKLYDTNYIYDSFGNLRVVLPPEASDKLLSSSSWTETDTNLKLYAYLYKYDSRNRCIAKKLPGCEWIYYVYDKADRLIFTQDGEQRSKGQWLFSIPDKLGRIIVSGICTHNLDYTADPLKNLYPDVYFVKAETSYKGYNVVDVGSYMSLVTLYTVNYYDNYDFLGLNGIPNTTDTQYTNESGYGVCYGDHQADNKYKNKGLLTGYLSAQQLSDGTISPTYLYSVMYYDTRGRLIQTKSNNYLSGGIEKEYIAYNFTGQPNKKKHVHQATGKTTQTEIYAYTYDHVGRLLSTTHQLNGGQVISLTENTYDELGRLYNKKKGGVGSTATTYGYNIRSWTKSITSSLFTEILYYNDIYGGSSKQYNGNIGAMSWKQSNEGYLRGYTFVYDNLSRLTTANYLKDGTLQTNNGTTPVFHTVYTYDKQGNIRTLQSYGKLTASAYGLADNLTLTYVGNQMVKVEDSAALISIGESADFKNNSNVATEYTYNANGAMKSDLNKGITDIQYNSLNLPSQMVINSSTVKAKNYYTYSASGVKLKTEQRYDPNYSVIPSNSTNPTNDGLTNYKNTDYVGNIIYETERNSAGVISKTRILVDGGYIEGGVYYYYMTDHLGNNRVVVNASGTVTQRNHYYPFGTAFAENTVDEQKQQPYKYNGKELDQMHGLNLYDYSARYYESAIGRFTSVDPLAEKYYSISPYAYCANNPINAVDLRGDTITTVIDGEVYYYGKHNDTYGFISKTTGKYYHGNNAYANALNKAIATLQLSARGFELVGFLSNHKVNIAISYDEKNTYRQGTKTISWNQSSTDSGVDENGEVQRPSFIALAHEMGHAEGIYKRDRFAVNGEHWEGAPEGVTISEKYATHVENQIRAQFGIPLRKYYSNNNDLGTGVQTGNPSTQIIDNYGNSLFYNQPIQLRNPITGKMIIITGGMPFRYK